MDSGFNILNLTIASVAGELIEIGSSSRFRYYIMRRNGILHFVKKPTEAFEKDLITLEALRKEFILGYGLNHPNIARYYAFEDNGIIEEYIDGLTLRQLIDCKDSRLSQKGFLEKIAFQILDALRYLHEKGVLHLDLKPENVMISRMGDQIKIIDLNCSKSASYDSTPGFTEEYMAPEQLSGDINISTDIYLVGKIIEELAAASGNLKIWRKFIGKSLAHHPDNRFKSTEEAIKAIPFPRNSYRKWIISILFGLIVCGMLSVIIGYPNWNVELDETNQQATIENQQSPLPEMQSQDPTPPVEIIVQQSQKPSTPPLPSLPSEEETEKMLTKKINKKLDELFSVKVTPLYEKMMADENYKNPTTMKEFIDAYTEQSFNIVAYGEELKTKYPDHASFIDEKVVKSFESRTSVMLIKLNRPNNDNSNKVENSPNNPLESNE